MTDELITTETTTPAAVQEPIVEVQLEAAVAAVDAAPPALIVEPIAPPAAPVIEVVRAPRVFVVGSTRITENDTTSGLTPEQVRKTLEAAYPEVANATIRERAEGDTAIVEFLPQPGRKG